MFRSVQNGVRLSMRREGFARITKGFEMRNSWNINGLQNLSNRVSPQFNAERRQSVRFQVEPMYSSVLVREIGVLAAPLAGHVYDLSLRGMRFDVDDAFEVGSEVEIELRLPGLRVPVIIRARVVREDEMTAAGGPVCVAVEFGRDARGALARKALTRLMAQRWLQLAA